MKRRREVHRAMAVSLGLLLSLAGAASAQPTATPESPDGPPPEPPVAPPPEAPAVDPPAVEPPLVEPAEVDTSEPVPSDVREPVEHLGFGFGSYGRVGVGTDLHGSTPDRIQVVAHGSRIAEPTYAELDLYYRMIGPGGVRVRTVTTLAFGDDLFHYTGEFDATPAIRNLYAEATNGELGGWIGSRMYRGDDIFLLDYWPLDEVNTVGAGLWWQRDRTALEVHAGANRLLTPFQYQERDVSDPVFGTSTIVQLDRQRFIASAKAQQRVFGDVQGPAAKVKLYAELQALPEGTRLQADNTPLELPRDWGASVGAQLGAWGFGPGKTHANLFARLSYGLSAFDELAPPVDFDATLKTFPRASELVLGTSGNYEIGPGGVLFGGYTRRFVDADMNVADRDDGWEYIVDVRPHATIAHGLGAALDLSYQARFPRGLSPISLIASDPAVFQVAPMLLYSPMGAGSYDRPQFRLIYRLAHLNEGARDLYPLRDPRRDREVVHFLGFQAEWWFNSTYR